MKIFCTINVDFRTLNYMLFCMFLNTVNNVYIWILELVSLKHSNFAVTDPAWASINRGILLCWECCQVHRTLGRHLSDIASLQHSNWAPPRLQVKVFLNLNN